MFKAVDKVKRFKAHYPELFTSKINLEKLKKVYERITPEDFLLVSYKEDLFREVAISLLMKEEGYTDAIVLNAYRLLDIYLGNTDEFKSIFDIDNRLVIIYLGYAEFENKRQSDILEQVVENQRVRGGKFWLMYKGTNIKEKYPLVLSKFKEYGSHIELSLDKRGTLADVDDI